MRIAGVYWLLCVLVSIVVVARYLYRTPNDTQELISVNLWRDFSGGESRACSDSSICSKYALMRSSGQPLVNSLSRPGRVFIFRDSAGMEWYLTQHNDTDGIVHLSGEKDGVQYRGDIKVSKKIPNLRYDRESLQSQRHMPLQRDEQDKNRGIYPVGKFSSQQDHSGETVKEVRSLTGYVNLGNEHHALISLHPVTCPNAVSLGDQAACGTVQYQCAAAVHLKISVFCPPFIPPAHASVWYDGKKYVPPSDETPSSSTIFVPGHGWLPVAGDNDFPACSQVIPCRM
jgi:hypothetical protein